MLHRFLFIFAILGTTSAAVGASPLSLSIRVSSETPLEAEIVEFVVTVRNDGSTDIESAQIAIEWPLMGYLVEQAGLDKPVIDHGTRKIESAIFLAGQSEKEIRLQVLAPRNSGGNALSVSVHLAHYPSSTDLWEHKTITIDTRLSTDGIRVGPTRITPAGIVMLLWVSGLFVLCLVIRTISNSKPNSSRSTDLLQRKPIRIAAALMVPIGFWLIFGFMAWRDYQTLTSWPEAKATIIGRREIVETSATNTGTGAKTTRQSSTTYSPEFALRYRVGDSDVYSTGYDTGSSLRIGGRALREQEMKDWVPGAEIRCWYNPANPRDVVVRRGFGGAYFFSLFTLPVFWIGVVQFQKLFTVR